MVEKPRFRSSGSGAGEVSWSQRRCWSSAFSFDVRLGDRSSGAIEPPLQLPLLLQNLELEPLDAIAQGLFPLTQGASSVPILRTERWWSAGGGSWGGVVMLVAIVGTGETALLQVVAGLERLYTAVLAFDLGVCAGEEESDVGAYFVAEGGLCGGEGGLGDEFVVANRLKDVDQAREVADASIKRLYGRL